MALHCGGNALKTMVTLASDAAARIARGQQRLLPCCALNFFALTLLRPYFFRAYPRSIHIDLCMADSAP